MCILGFSCCLGYSVWLFENILACLWRWLHSDGFLLYPLSTSHFLFQAWWLSGCAQCHYSRLSWPYRPNSPHSSTCCSGINELEYAETVNKTMGDVLGILEKLKEGFPTSLWTARKAVLKDWNMLRTTNRCDKPAAMKPLGHAVFGGAYFGWNVEILLTYITIASTTALLKLYRRKRGLTDAILQL